MPDDDRCVHKMSTQGVTYRCSLPDEHNQHFYHTPENSDREPTGNSIRDESTPRGSRIWADVDKAAARAPGWVRPALHELDEGGQFHETSVNRPDNRGRGQRETIKKAATVLGDNASRAISPHEREPEFCAACGGVPAGDCIHRKEAREWKGLMDHANPPQCEADEVSEGAKDWYEKNAQPLPGYNPSKSASTRHTEVKDE